MNVEKELSDVRRRVRVQIDRSAREALIRAGVDVEAEEAAARAAQREARQRAADAAAEQLGRNLRAINDSIRRAAEAIARGFNGGVR